MTITTISYIQARARIQEANELILSIKEDLSLITNLLVDKERLKSA